MDNHQRSTWPLTDIEHPLANDVVYGRGGLANNHKGNKRFRAIVNTYKGKYATCSRHEKTAMAQSLVRQWRAQTPPGRFLKPNKATGLWDDVGRDARAKCSQLLREKVDSKDEDEFDEEVLGATEANEEEHVPPPVASPPVYTPPQIRPSRDINPVSPDSVMDMPFFCVESVAMADSVRKPEAQAAFSDMMKGLEAPGLSGDKKLKRTSSSRSLSSVEEKHAAKRPTPLGSFLGKLLPKGKNISIQQDNAAGSPSRQKKAAVKKEALASISCPMEVQANDSPLPGLETDAAVSSPHAKISAQAREKSIDQFLDMELCVAKSAGFSERDESWKSIDVNFDDDPILQKYAALCASSNHTMGSRSRMSTLSVDSSTGSLNNLVEDLGSLSEMFRERCTSSDSKRANAMKRWEAAYGGDSDSQPELDDMSMISTTSFLGERDEEQVVDTTMSQQDGLDGGTRHTTFTFDSANLDMLLDGI